MNGKDLLEAMSYVDEAYVDEAERPAARRMHWRPIVAAAACFCLIAFTARYWMIVQSAQKLQIAAQSAAEKETAFAIVSEEAMMDAAPANGSLAAAAPVSLTVRTVSLSDGILTAVVTDPGTSSLTADAVVKFALTEEEQTLWLPDFGQKREITSLRITFLPEESEILHPLEISRAEEE